MSGGTNPVDDFARLTLDEYLQEKTQDQFFEAHNLLRWLEERVETQRRAGGDNLVININVDENDKGGSYSGLDLFNNDAKDTLETTYFKYSKYQWPIVATADEVLRNRGSSEKIADLWIQKGDIAMESLNKRLNTDLFGDGTGNDNKNLEGLEIAIDSAGTYGLLDRSVTTVWQANEQAVGGGLAIPGASGMTNMLHDCSLGSGAENGIDLLITTQTQFEAYEAIIDTNIRYTSVESGDGGFKQLLFKGIPFMWDRAATSGVMYFMASSRFIYVVHPEREFIQTEVQNAENGAPRDGWESNLLVWLQLVNKEPRRSGKLTGLT